MIVSARPDGINPIEPVAGMQLKRVKELVGDKVCIIGNIDCAHLLPHGSPEDVRAAVRQAIADAAPGGGYILTSSNCIHLLRPEKLHRDGASLPRIRKLSLAETPRQAHSKRAIGPLLSRGRQIHPNNTGFRAIGAGEREPIHVEEVAVLIAAAAAGDQADVIAARRLRRSRPVRTT